MVFLFHGMNLVTLAEGSACLLFTIFFSGILKLGWHLYAFAEHIATVCWLREKRASIFSIIGFELYNAAIKWTDQGKFVILLGICC